jgi:hypothetical protein
MQVEELVKALEGRGFRVEDVGVLLCYRQDLNIRLQVFNCPQGKGVIGLGVAKHFNKWGDSDDFICYRLPKAPEQIDLLLEGVGELIKAHEYCSGWALRKDVTYLLRRRKPKQVIRKRTPKLERKRPKLLNRRSLTSS